MPSLQHRPPSMPTSSLAVTTSSTDSSLPSMPLSTYFRCAIRHVPWSSSLCRTTTFPLFLERMNRASFPIMFRANLEAKCASWHFARRSSWPPSSPRTHLPCGSRPSPPRRSQRALPGQMVARDAFPSSNQARCWPFLRTSVGPLPPRRLGFITLPSQRLWVLLPSTLSVLLLPESSSTF